MTRPKLIPEPFIPSDAKSVSAMTVVWNKACGPSLAISEGFMTYNVRPATGLHCTGRIVRQGRQIVGLVLASMLPNNPNVTPPTIGCIDAVAVIPAVQRQGIGSRLLAWAEDWLRAQHCTRSRLGASLHPFVPGYPVELANRHFFYERGYQARAGSGSVWDMARDLGDYSQLYVPCQAVEIRPMQNQDTEPVRAFLQREFPSRWLFEFEEFLRERGRSSDYMLLLTERGVDGFARLTFEDSERPIDRFYLHKFPRPWGQLGPIGVSKDARGKGYGGMLLDASLLHLHERGIRGCVIDWTDLIEFYGKFGFKPYREYAMLGKAL